MVQITSFGRRTADNESVFREYNERIQQGFDKIEELAAESGQTALVPKHDITLHFYCECSDENCHERVLVKPSRYNAIHRNRRRFIVKRGHETPAIESIVSVEHGYCIVEKLIRPPDHGAKLHKTGINNT